MQQALDDICGAKLCEINSMSSRMEMIRLMDKAITALRQALAQLEHPLDKKAANARELGLDYEPDVTFIDEGNIPDHGFDRTASHMAGEYADTAGTEHQFKYVAYGLRADENGKLSVGELPKREWVELTNEEIKDILDCGRGGLIDIKKAETKLREKNE